MMKNQTMRREFSFYFLIMPAGFILAITRIVVILAILNAGRCCVSGEVATETVFFAEPSATNTACLRDGSKIQANQARGLCMGGIATWSDDKHGLLVLQDAEGAVALHVNSSLKDIHPGQKICVQSDAVAVSQAGIPEFPLAPTSTEWLPALAGPTNSGFYYLARMHGFLIPPRTGDYKFWIASKTSSEFWFSTNASSCGLRKIAFVPDGRAANPGQYDKFPTQVSEPIHLDAGRPYLFDVMHEHRAGRNDTVSVAWQGPGIERTIIDGQFLVPYANRNTNGIIREFWNDYFLASVQSLTAGKVESPEFVAANPRIKVLGESPFPNPVPVEIGANLSSAQGFQWVEVQGVVQFAARGEDNLTVVLAKDHKRLEIKLPASAKLDFRELIGMEVRARGICVAAVDESGSRTAGVIWVPSEKEFSEIGISAGVLQKTKLTSIGDLNPGNPALAPGRLVRIRGAILRRDSGRLVVQGTARYCGYVSTNGTEWKPVTPSVDILTHDSAIAGLLVSSLIPGELATARFDSVIGVDSSARDMEIADATPVGRTVVQSGGKFIVQGGGMGFGTIIERVHFYGGQLGGKKEVVARIVDLQSRERECMAGVMVRDSADARSSFASLTINGNGTSAFHFRERWGERDEAVNLAGVSLPCWLKLVRTVPTVELRDDRILSADVGETVDLAGSLQWDGTVAFLTDVRRLDGLSQARPPVSPAENADVVVPIHIAQIVPERNEGLREGSGLISVRGIVTFNGPAFGTNYLIIQDDTGGDLVRLTARLSHRTPAVGHLVELQTRSQNGKWPFPLDPSQMQIVGLAHMPEPLSLAAANTQLRRGEFYQVECRGIVRDAVSGEGLKLVTQNQEISVCVSEGSETELKRLVDALVQVRGALVYRDNKASLLVPSLACVEVVEPAPRDPFSVPTVEISQLAGFSRRASTCHRIKIAGVVTGKKDRLLVVQDGTGGVRVNTSLAADVLVGDSVEVAGFPDGQAGSFSLSQTIVRKSGNFPMPAVAVISGEELYSGKCGQRVVQLRGELLGQRTDNGNPVFEIQSGQRIFRAGCFDSRPQFKSIPVGSLVQVTGISWPEPVENSFAGGENDGAAPPAFTVLMRTPEDITVLQWPPWWAWKHATIVIGTLGLVLAAALLWIRYLRLKVERRTQQLKETMIKLERETETSATLAERNRLAGEIHDGLEQGLSAIMMQLDGLESKLGANPAGVAHHLELARSMVRFSRTEVRHSLWEWKSPALADKDLAGALTEIANQMSAGNETQVAVQVSGNVITLPAAIEHHLLRIAQEALNNALKYAAASNVNIALEYRDSIICLTVRDNGRGFDPDAVLGGGDGHFGLQNLRSRTRKLGGTLKIDSAAGRGTIIEATVPMPKPDVNELGLIS